MSVVNANTYVGAGCIISVGAIVDHDVNLGTCCHINAGAIVNAGAMIENFRKLEAGEVALGYDKAWVNGITAPDSNSEFAKQYREQIGEEISFF